MTEHTNNLIIGQGLAGTTLAWRLLDAGESVVIVDRSEESTASKVAAGLVTPWTGRRMTQSDDYPDNWYEAETFYRKIEETLQTQLYQEQSMLRVFVNRSDGSVFSQRQAEYECGGLTEWSGRLQQTGRELEGCRMEPAARLDVSQYLQKSIDYFTERGQWYQLDLRLPDGLIIETDRIVVRGIDLSADRVIFCQGAAENPWFKGIPNNASRGDVINISIDDYHTKEVVHQSMWLAPEPDGSITAGATYDWKNTEIKPSAKGRREILRSIKRFIDGPIRVNRHTAAIRPTMKDYRPVVGQHHEQDRLWIFNGLGSRGVLTAPLLSRLLAESMTGTGTIPEEIKPDRLLKQKRSSSLTVIAQEEISKTVKPGSTVIDGTVGNGFDTSFLSQIVGEEGRVYGFDIQQQAIESTRKRLAKADQRNVELHQRCHADVGQVVSQPVQAAMFNLGYLPRSDHTIVTQATSTIEALDQIKSRLVDDGVITVLAYRGHEGGPQESIAVETWLQQQTDGTVERIDSQPKRETSPVLFVYRKSKAV